MELSKFIANAQYLVDARSCRKIHDVEFEEIAQLFSLPHTWSDEFSHRMQRHYIVTWWCSSQWVGLSVLALDGKIVAVSMQTARKNYTSIHFINTAAMERTFRVALEYVNKEDYSFMIDPELNISDDWFTLEKPNIIVEF